MKNKIACISLLLALTAVSAAHAECPKWERLSQSGQQSIEAGDYSKAEQTWLKAVAEADNCGERDPAMPLSLKRLGECYQKNGKLFEAADAFKRSADRFKINGADDVELIADLAALAKVYRTIDISELDKPVAEAFKQTGVNLIGLCKLDQGDRFQITLDDKFVKQINNNDVDQVSLEKLVSFDVVEQPDGSLSINNIKGLKVHAKMWVTIVQSHLLPKDPDGASAEVTAQKMGISKTVSCKLPSDSIEPMNTLIAKLKDFNNGVTPTSASSTDVTSTTKTDATSALNTDTTSVTSTPAATGTPSATSTPSVTSTTSITGTSSGAGTSSSTGTTSIVGTTSSANKETTTSSSTSGVTETKKDDSSNSSAKPGSIPESK
jgi:hypothetical protein